MLANAEDHEASDAHKEYRLCQYSPFTWLVERGFQGLKYLPPQLVLTLSQKDRPALRTRDKEKTAKRARAVEYYVMICFVIVVCLGILCVQGYLPAPWIIVAASLQILDVIQASANISVFDQLRGPETYVVASIPRTLVLTFFNFLELMVNFSFLYFFVPSLKSDAPIRWFDAFYFSVVTQLTIGYGDIRPLGPAKALVVVQGVAGLMLIVLALGRVIAGLGRFDEVFPSQGRKK